VAKNGVVSIAKTAEPDERLERTTTSKDVTDVLRRRILEGRYKANEFIRQDLVATELGVSRIPVREALAKLEAEGLVVHVKYRGALVAQLSFEEIREIYEMRAMLEPWLLQLAVENITKDQVKALRKIVERARKTNTVAEWSGMNVEFHRTLFEAAGRPLAMQVLDNLLMRADRYLKLQNFASITTKQESDAQHLAILDLVEKRDVDGAVSALREHIHWNADDVRKLIQLGVDVPLETVALAS
jgi:DNA-binding GntR family transcriptional regulator